VDWKITLSAQRADVERLLSESIDGLSGDPGDPRRLVRSLDIQEVRSDPTATADLAKNEVHSRLDLLNALGKLRWGRTFEGVKIEAIRSFDEKGRATQRAFLGIAYDHMLPEDYADMIERMGRPRPPLPKGIEVINGLKLADLIGVAENRPDAVRAVRLVDLMLQGDEEINWAAGYAAVEIVVHGLRSRGVDGRQAGWWTKKELEDFKATANSPEALGLAARHGKPMGLAEARMTTKEASWFVRRIVAQWLSGPAEGDQSDTPAN
jgi:hypothetical protein